MRIIETLGGLWQLSRLAFHAGVRPGNAYWSWRLHTAFGKSPPTRGQMIPLVLDYARWVHRTRRTAR